MVCLSDRPFSLLYFISIFRILEEMVGITLILGLGFSLYIWGPY